MTKTDNLMPVIASPANLLQAWRSIRGNIPKYRRKNCVGPDGISMSEFEQDLQCQISILRYQLLKGRYQPTQPVYFSVPKKDGSTRKLALLSVSDRVVQRAVQQVIEPFWEKIFLPCSFGYRPGLSVNDAIGRVSQMRNLGNSWIVNGDIDGFFDNLDQGLLLKYFGRLIKDQQVVKLVTAWLTIGAAGLNFNSKLDLTINKHTDLPIDWLMSKFDMKSAHQVVSKGYHQDEGYEGPPYLIEGDQTESTNGTNILLRHMLQQAISGSLMSFGGYAKPLAYQAISSLREAGYSIAFKKLALKTLLGTGCLAAVGTAFTGYLMYKKSSNLGKGVLQGSPLSPLLANIYLHPFDHALVQNGYHLVRYADDWLLMASTEDQAHQAYNQAIRYLSALHLRINQEKTKIIPPGDKFSWLGTEIQPISAVRQNFSI